MDELRSKRSKMLHEIEERLGKIDLLGLHESGAEGEYSGLTSRIVSSYLGGHTGSDLLEDVVQYIWNEYELRASEQRLRILEQDLMRGGVLWANLERLKAPWH